MKSRYLLGALLLLLVFGGSLLLLQTRNQSLQFTGVNRMILRTWIADGSATNSVTIANADGITEFLSALRVRRKEPCSCLHLYAVVFEMEGEVAEASICDHCFDLTRSNKVENYSMPPAFWTLVKRRLTAPSP